MRVDLPAPFSPTSAWISPARTEKLIPSFAFTVPNCFETLCASIADISGAIARNRLGVVQLLKRDRDFTGDHFAADRFHLCMNIVRYHRLVVVVIDVINAMRS